MGRDENTPQWVQHIAFQLEDESALLAAKDELEAHGIEVLGPTDHGIIQSIYLFDPNGHRLELTTVTASASQNAKTGRGQMGNAGRLDEVEEGSQTCRLVTRRRVSVSKLILCEVGAVFTSAP